VWHLHVVVAVKADIRTGTDIETLSNYKLPYWMRRGKHLRNEALAAEWQVLRETCCKYRFGRAERNDGEDKKRPLPADNGADVRRWERKNSDSFFICVNLRHLRAIPDLVAAGRAVPLVFGKGQFESGVAAMMLREFAQDPFPYELTG
jgi:hypothetical protein